jgi:hypothetical protein
MNNSKTSRDCRYEGEECLTLRGIPFLFWFALVCVPARWAVRHSLLRVDCQKSGLSSMVKRYSFHEIIGLCSKGIHHCGRYTVKDKGKGRDRSYY